MTPVETQSQPNNRRVLQGAAVVAGAAALGMMAQKPARAITPALKFSDIPGTGDVKVLNYALALEDLEADLYSQALKRLTGGGTNALGTTIPPLNITATEIDVQYLQKFGVVEAQHRDFLRGTLAANAIAPYKYNFGIETLTRQQVLNLVYTAEQTGVGAYLGALKYFATNTYVRVAGAIQGTEARHTATLAIVQNILFNAGLNTAPLATQNNGIDAAVEPDTVLAAVSAYIVANPT